MSFKVFSNQLWQRTHTFHSYYFRLQQKVTHASNGKWTAVCFITIQNIVTFQSSGFLSRVYYNNSMILENTWLVMWCNCLYNMVINTVIKNDYPFFFTKQDDKMPNMIIQIKGGHTKHLWLTKRSNNPCIWSNYSYLHINRLRLVSYPLLSENSDYIHGNKWLWIYHLYQLKIKKRSILVL